MMENCPIHCVDIGCPVESFLQKHESFILTIVASTSAGIGLLLTYFLKSRCKKITLCCIQCDRDPIELTTID